MRREFGQRMGWEVDRVKRAERITAAIDRLSEPVAGFVLDEEEIDMEDGMMLIAPEGVAHGIRNTSQERLIVLALLAPAP